MRGLFKLLAGLLLLAAHPIASLVTRVQGRCSIILISLLHMRVTTRMVRVGEYCGGDAPLSTPYLAAFHKREEVALGCQADSPSDAVSQVPHSLIIPDHHKQLKLVSSIRCVAKSSNIVISDPTFEMYSQSIGNHCPSRIHIIRFTLSGSPAGCRRSFSMWQVLTRSILTKLNETQL